MKIPFCPDCQIWHSLKDEVVTLSEYLALFNWSGDSLHITGCQPGDYYGLSNLFNVTMSRELAEQFFGCARVLSAELHNVDEINVLDRTHLANWALSNGIKGLGALKERYGEYRRQFPQNCFRSLTHVQISAGYDINPQFADKTAKTHELKILPQYFCSEKNFELRKNDRGFAVGDIVVLREWSPDDGYTGRYSVHVIQYILENAKEYGLAEGYCILSLSKSVQR